MSNRDYRYGESSRDNLKSVDHRLQQVCYEAQRIANNANPHMFIPDWGYSEGYRSPSRQKRLYDQGRTEPGEIVTYIDGITEVSPHQKRIAIDLFAYIHGNASYQPEHIQPVILCHFQAACKVGHPIKWGGLFGTFNDSPHLELVL